MALRVTYNVTRMVFKFARLAAVNPEQTMSKRPLPWSGTDEHEYDEDYSPYTRVRLIMQNGRYEDELDLLRLKTTELQARVAELDHEIDEIINLDMEDVISLKQDVHLYYRQYRRARLDALELQEELAKTRTNGSNGTDEHKLSDELIALRAELTELERRINPDVKDVGSEGIEQVESEVSDRINTEGVTNENIEHKPSDEAILLQAELIELENQVNSDVTRVFDNNTLTSLPRFCVKEKGRNLMGTPTNQSNTQYASSLLSNLFNSKG
ncbi:hypothetical protein C8R41DRAFT_915650 [Lentinula lateritia]|uniref:Uncharacterized protein n=1 Tax=Lentinula lateritia TaxID=40482 RepID=A0ABQ8VU59_9AGAR|nr:hypothetical protein C8R41DRAFT_915650 [Lentinula lateritia]